MSHRFGRGWVAVAAVVAVIAGGCALVPVPTRPESVPVRADRPCTSAAVRSCALPFPSDEFTVADAATSTGRRIVMPDELFPESLLAPLGPGAAPADAVAGADGFSAVTPVMFEVAEAVDPASLPADGGDVLVVFDLATGERVPVRTEVPAEAARHGSADTVVVAWPRTRLEYGRTYVARLGDGLRTRSGAPSPRATGLDRAGDPHVAQLRADLRQLEGDDWDRVVSATRFTVRSETNATAELDAMAATARAVDHPIRNVSVEPPWLVPDAAAVLSGEVRLSDFRDADGVARVANGATQRWERFVMVLPRTPAGPSGAPVVIYGHGLTISKESMLVTAASNARLGMATIGIDVPNHGDRQIDEGGYLLELTTPHAFGRLASMPLQGVVDHVSLLMAVQDHLGALQVEVPAWLDRPASTSVPLDTSTLLYQGTSMGGVLGGAFVALAPELDGAFLQVAGSGIADTIFHSLLWILFMSVIPQGASTGDAYALMGGATMLLDHADNSNLLHRIDPASTPVFLAYGAGDGVVGNFASDRMIALADLPLVGPQLVDVEVPFRRTGGESVPADGHGAAQIWPDSSPELQSFAAHVSFAQDRSVALLEQWLRGRLSALGVAD